MDTPLLTIFSIPRAFTGQSALLQRNAITSWARLGGVEVILFGDEQGLAETARALNVRHEKEIDRNQLGTPMVSDAFARVRKLARSPLVAFVNGDIILTRDFMIAIDQLSRAPFKYWLAVGQRHDLDQQEAIGDATDWEASILGEVATRGRLHGKAGLDYFVFAKDLPIALPPLAVGRPGWDSWLMFAVRQAGFALVDVTAAVTAIHQNHPPAYTANGPEAIANRRSAGGAYRMGTLRDANWRLVAAGGGWALERSVIGQLWFAPPVRALLALKRVLSRGRS